MGLRTLHSPGSTEAVVRRFDRLTPGTPPRWGRLDAPHMLAHVTDHLRVALGDLALPPAPGMSWCRGALRAPLVHWMPWPRHWRTSAVAYVTPLNDWPADCDRLAEIMMRFVARPFSAECGVHPALGPLTGDEWSRLAWRHLDYHLGQFGV